MVEPLILKSLNFRVLEEPRDEHFDYLTDIEKCDYFHEVVTTTWVFVLLMKTSFICKKKNFPNIHKMQPFNSVGNFCIL